jgi:hypothetical protein
MNPKQHANMLGIFFWVLAGIQGLFLGVIVIYLGYFGHLISQADRGTAKMPKDAAMALTVMGVFVGLYLLVAFSFCVTNVAAGWGLRNDRPWARRWVTIASIMAFLSFLSGGLLLMPVGIALGVYGVWFVFGDYGNYYFAHQHNPEMLYPDQPQRSYAAPRRSVEGTLRP